MALSDRLRKIRLAFEEGPTPDGDIRILDTHVASMGAAARNQQVIQPGAEAPGFAMASTCGRSLTLDALLRKGPIVLVWFRGTW